jgi:hypothetical protein
LKQLKQIDMKRQVRIILGIALIGATLWSCSKTEGGLDSNSFKSAINLSAQDLNSAMATISSTKAFSILTVDGGTMMKSASSMQKSSTAIDSIYRVYIPLEKISGVYDYHPVVKKDRWGQPLINFFTRISDSSLMVVNMPLEKVKNPRALRSFSAADSTLTNNFTIAVSEYHNNYNSYWDYDYALASQISVDNEVAGNLNINSLVSPKLGVHLTSEYAFSGSYTAKYQYDSGDTTVSSFSIMNDGNVLYQEKLLTVRNDTARFGREHQYILTIGDVQIVRKSATKTVEVFVNGVLQPNATVTIVDQEEDSEASACKKREIQITFEDGTSTTVSALIGQSIDNIKTLFQSLHTVYFAAYVVDWIAYDIYYQRN